MDENKLHRIAEVAARLRVSTAYAYRIAANGELATVRAGRAVRVTESAVQEWIRAHTRGGVRS